MSTMFLLSMYTFVRPYVCHKFENQKYLRYFQSKYDQVPFHYQTCQLQSISLSLAQFIPSLFQLYLHFPLIEANFDWGGVHFFQFFPKFK